MHDPSQHRPAHAAEAPAARATAIDPVCGMTVRLDAGKPTYEHKGATYHFCSQGCRTKFAADPGRYLKASPAAGAGGHAHHDHGATTPRP